jgi:Tfp pilus assembly protein PilN
MALHLNLYHEIQKQHRAAKRDPLKLGMYGLALVILGFIGYYFLRVAHVSEFTTRLSSLEQEWQNLEPKRKAAEERELELRANMALADSLVKRIEGRFYWAPMLDRLMQTVPREVQIIRLDASRAADKTRTVSFTLNGVSTGNEPRKVAEDLRTALAAKFEDGHSKSTATFKLLEDREERVQLDGQALRTATFAIQLDVVPDENATAAAAATPRQARR